jgi:hypothetical protein
MRRKRIVLYFIVLVAIAAGIAYWRLTASPPPSSDGKANDIPPLSEKQDDAGADTEEAKARRQVLGVWYDDYRGKRTMILNDDGTGTMWTELSGVDAFFAAPKLRFDMKWSLNGKDLKKRTVGGEPADKVNMILNLMGNTAEDTILELTEDRLLLLDKDGKQKYDWRRVK